MKPTITVAIPAFNEEKTIARLLHYIKLQNKTEFKIEAMKVLSDGSTDNTVGLVRKNFKDVTVIDSKINLGKIKRINQIVKSNSSDILILADSDIILKDKNVFNKIVRTFRSGQNIGLVCAYHKAIKPKAFIGRLAYFGFQVWDRGRATLGSKGSLYYCEGGLIALSKEFARNYRIPSALKTADDTFIFFNAVERGFRVKVAKTALVYIELPNNYKDYIRQMRRFLSDPIRVREFFDKTLIEKYQIMNYGTKLDAWFKEFIENPLLGIAYLLLQSWTKLLLPLHKVSSTWKPIKRN